MEKSQTLFVSAFIDLHIPHEEHKTLAMRLSNFEKLARTGVPLVVFTSKKYIESVMDLIINYPNVRLHRAIEIEETETYKLFENYKDNLPQIRYGIKDKFEFMTLMNAKLEFMRDVLGTYSHIFKQFAWIDFNIWYIFKDNAEVTKRLQFYALHTLERDGIHIPGCWDSGRDADLLWNRINWRFCGGFFMGNTEAVLDFVNKYFNNIETIIQKTNALTWEVNIWSHLENEYGWKPCWYYGDHNESMIQIPYDRFIIQDDSKIMYNNQQLRILCKCKGGKFGKYLLPPLPGYEPTSSSFIIHNGQKILNIRYVNYTLTPQGAYIVRHPNGFLKTKNVCAILNGEYEVIDSAIMSDSPNDIISKRPHIQGVEDIRLFEHNSKLMYIATQREYSEHDVNRMIIGEYNSSDLILSASSVLEPPEFTGCEKNWIPIELKKGLHFIYKWYPFQIGMLDDNNMLVIRNEYIVPRIFERMRGSSIFIPCGDDSVVGVIHYSEEGVPRKYFHALVWLDKETGQPTHISDTFIFNKMGIEFCIGFTIENDIDDIQYGRFWFSQHDRDPMWLRIPFTEFIKRPIG